MAQTGYTPISLYYSATASSVPVNTNLTAGELAINTNDGKLYYKDSSGVVQLLASKAGSSGTFGAISATSITNSGLTSGRVVYSTTGGLETDSANLLFNGTTLTANTLNLTNALGTAYGGTGVTTSTGSGNNVLSTSPTITTPVISSLSSASATALTLQSAGTTAVTITTGGNLLIGSTTNYGSKVYASAGGSSSPASSGNMTTGYIFGAGDGAQALNFGQDSNGTWYNSAYVNNAGVGLNHRWYVGGSEVVRIDSSGNVGIGGTPAQKLDVIGSGSRTRWNTSNAYVYQVISNPADSAYATNRVDAASHDWYVSNSAKMTLDSSGNVGIGITTIGASNRLNVVGNNVVFSPNTGSKETFVFTTGLADKGALYIKNDTTNTIKLDTNGDSYLNGGNVGINTTSPATKLNVAISAANETTSALRVTNLNTSGYGVGIEFSDEFSVSGRLAARIATNTPINGPTADLYFQTRTASALTEKMRIASTGNVGIGTASAYTTIQVWVGTDTNGSTGQGGASIQGGGTGNIDVGHASGTSSGATYQRFIYNASVIGSITQNGTANVAYNTSSDYRLKENIQPMQNALATISQLKPVTYKWKTDGSDGQGFIAHELQAVIPDCVTGEKDAVETYTDEDGNEQTRPKYQGIDTSFLVATLTAALQETKALIDTQAETINALTARIVALETK